MGFFNNIYSEEDKLYEKILGDYENFYNDRPNCMRGIFILTLSSSGDIYTCDSETNDMLSLIIDNQNYSNKEVYERNHKDVIEKISENLKNPIYNKMLKSIYGKKFVKISGYTNIYSYK